MASFMPWTLFSVAMAHLCYWDNKDVCTFILRTLQKSAEKDEIGTVINQRRKSMTRRASGSDIFNFIDTPDWSLSLLSCATSIGDSGILWCCTISPSNDNDVMKPDIVRVIPIKSSGYNSTSHSVLMGVFSESLTNPDDPLWEGKILHVTVSEIQLYSKHASDWPLIAGSKKAVAIVVMVDAGYTGSNDSARRFLQQFFCPARSLGSSTTATPCPIFYVERVDAAKIAKRVNLPVEPPIIASFDFDVSTGDVVVEDFDDDATLEATVDKTPRSNIKNEVRLARSSSASSVSSVNSFGRNSRSRSRGLTVGDLKVEVYE